MSSYALAIGTRDGKLEVEATAAVVMLPRTSRLVVKALTEVQLAATASRQNALSETIFGF